MNLLRSLANPSFALLWSGQTLSRLGDSFYTIALALWVLEKTGSATTMGLVLICSSVPTLLLLLFGGVFVDRFSRLGVMLSSDFLRAGVVGLIALLAVTGRLECGFSVFDSPFSDKIALHLATQEAAQTTIFA